MLSGCATSKQFAQSRCEPPPPETCSSPASVFKINFRKTARLQGPFECSKSTLTSAELKQADKDAKAAAFAYSQRNMTETDLAKTQERRFNADRNGYGVGLADRAYLGESRQDSGLRESYRNQFEKILAGYPSVIEEDLTQDSACAKELK